MRIFLVLILLAALGLSTVMMLEFVDDLKEPPVVRVSEYYGGKIISGHVTLKEGRLYYPDMFWSEGKSGRIQEVYIPIVPDGNEAGSPKLFLRSRSEEDREIAKKLGSLDEKEILNYFLNNRDKLNPRIELDVRTTSEPVLKGFTLPKGVVYVENAGGNKRGFPTIPVSLMVAAAFFLITSWKLPRTFIQAGNETLTLAGLANHEKEQLPAILAAGGRIVFYQYCFSILIMTFKRPSEFYLLRPGENALVKGLHCSFVSAIVGWWGIPWGPIYTIGSFIKNFGGGTDVTDAFLPVEQPPPIPSSN